MAVTKMIHMTSFKQAVVGRHILLVRWDEEGEDLRSELLSFLEEG